MGKIKTRTILLYFFILTMIGAIGFYIIEGDEWNFIDSIYMTVITLSTVGFGEVHQLSDLGKLWAIGVIIFGVSGVAVFISRLGENLMEIREQRREKIRKRFLKMRKHYIIFGYGRMGQVITEELVNKKLKYIVVENDEDSVELLQEKGYQYYKGDATEDETLEAVGAKYAKGIVVALGTEQDNLFVTMSVRTLNPDAYVVSRCSHVDSTSKLIRAGANKVVNPYTAGGHKMAELLIDPNIEDTVSISTPHFDIDLAVEEIDINDYPSLIGVTIVESKIRLNYNLIIIGIKDKLGKFELNPNMDYTLNKDQSIMLIGGKDNLKRFQREFMNRK